MAEIEKIKLYNTLTRKKEDFVPVKANTAMMYSCGPTVYNYAHIGNLRTYIFMDLLRRTLKIGGYKLKGVINITDVGHLLSDADEGEDKMALAAAEQKKSPEEIASYYTAVFIEDIKKLNISLPEVTAKATDHIKEMIDYVVALKEKGYAYETSDGIYFDIQKFEGYGKLSRINLDEQIAGARVEVNSEKRHPADFALWKKAEKNHIMKWESPWGLGYPGWHIECSAMSKKYLGKLFDIHTGGVDHIPIHHENEIAQSEALESGKTVNFWMHGEFMLVDGGKMSKSLKNTYTVSELESRGYSPLDFRYFCLNAHYRKTLNFTFEGLDAAKSALLRLYAALHKHKASPAKTEAKTIDAYKKDFYEAVFDDINIPMALGVLWKLIKLPYSKDIFNLAVEFDKIFGLNLVNAPAPETDTVEDEIPLEIIKLAEERLTARKNKDFNNSDVLRAAIAEKGYTVLDSKDSYTIKKTP